MKTFRDLFIHLNGFSMETLIDLMTGRCTENWVRAEEREKDARVIGEKAFCFEHTSGDGLESAGLSLFNKEKDTWYVPNIVPLEKSELSWDQYNDVLRNFYENIVQPAILGIPVTVELSNDQIFLKDVVGVEAASLLEKFSVLANKSTGSAHPYDRNRWFDFISAVHETGAHLNTDLLIRTLEEEGWPEEAAHGLAIEYEFAIALLDYKEGR